MSNSMLQRFNLFRSQVIAPLRRHARRRDVVVEPAAVGAEPLCVTAANGFTVRGTLDLRGIFARQHPDETEDSNTVTAVHLRYVNQLVGDDRAQSTGRNVSGKGLGIYLNEVSHGQQQ